MENILKILYWPPLYAVALAYCVWRIIKRYNRTSLDGVVGTGPATETLAYAICPVFFAIIDLVVTFIKYIKNKYV